MNTQTIIAVIDIILAAAGVLSILYSLAAPMVFDRELRADKVNYMKGWAYGFSRGSLKHWIRMWGTSVEQLSMMFFVTLIFTALWYIGAYWVLALQVAVPMLGLLLKKVPQPKWALMDKLILDLKINLG